MLSAKEGFDIIDAHFAYPEGYAAVLLGARLKKPVTITLRGTINRLIKMTGRREAIRYALRKADKVFAVSSYLAGLGRSLGINENKFITIPNGVDTDSFKRLDKVMCRDKLGLPRDAKILVSVGALTKRKGHHRVLAILGEVIKLIPNVILVIVGGPSVEGDMGSKLRSMASDLGLSQRVVFTGEVLTAKVNEYLCSGDLFVLATQYEGWANVFLEAMACGLPVITTDVCGNPEVVSSDRYGILVPFGDSRSLMQAIVDGIYREWDRDEIMRYARSRPWSVVGGEVYIEFQKVLADHKQTI